MTLDVQFSEGDGAYSLICLLCNKVCRMNWNYCPNCGAKL